VKDKRWLLLSRWVHVNTHKKRPPDALFALNRRVMKAYLLKKGLDRLWTYTYGEAMLRYLKSCIAIRRRLSKQPAPYGLSGLGGLSTPLYQAGN
jgi:hypothetical protein